MNAPEYFELFCLPKDVKKVSFEPDKRIDNAGTFTIYLEDHTMGNLIRMQLHRDPRVKFAGYNVPHPLEKKIEVKIQTREGFTPAQVIRDAMTCLKEETATFLSEFQNALQIYKELETGLKREPVTLS